ncbi:hypothetical protein AVEN_14767-1 [Araneus ventricosus]|uniref:Uncharacterized protein n=1 Tax=Araneus ventricosus TaxID=182803 RepID=A0A4Y2HQR1_ARAVE|nr:hypothetical protein AVEN_17785-1 [Araneus ventricosus]GBM67567.1 hypothetical protein AVEN_260421-1 [Araneus ventricosus]GBM67588.1 hypothetical protein AVEN_117858-1 [Araneus ventricosus]GBM68511.1 hypothetical protein AVEN_14767-1 [Araneus ventricosus]
MQTIFKSKARQPAQFPSKINKKRSPFYSGIQENSSKTSGGGKQSSTRQRRDASRRKRGTMTMTHGHPLGLDSARLYGVNRGWNSKLLRTFVCIF